MPDLYFNKSVGVEPGQSKISNKGVQFVLLVYLGKFEDYDIIIMSFSL